MGCIWCRECSSSHVQDALRFLDAHSFYCLSFPASYSSLTDNVCMCFQHFIAGSGQRLKVWMHLHLERMREGHLQMVGNFHRRSLVIEPRADQINATKMPDSKSIAGISTAGESTVTEARPKTSGSVHPTIKSIKPHGQTFELLFKASFNFKSRPEIPRVPDDMGQTGQE